MTSAECSSSNSLETMKLTVDGNLGCILFPGCGRAESAFGREGALDEPAGSSGGGDLLTVSSTEDD